MPYRERFELNLELVEATIEYICSAREFGDGAILVFLTGWDDIKNLAAQLQSNRIRRDTSASVCFRCGSCRRSTRKRFSSAHPRACVKTILATNIAETSIIDDIVFVVDGGAKAKTYDAVNNIVLAPAPVSQAAARGAEGEQAAFKMVYAPSFLQQQQADGAVSDT